MIKTLRPPVVYVSDRARADERCMARFERMMTSIECDNIVDVTDDDIERLVVEKGWADSRRYSGSRKEGDPPILLNRYRWLSPKEEKDYARRFPQRFKGWYGARFFGFGPFTFRDRDAEREHHNIICQNAWEIHSATGCLFKCDFCSFEDFLNIMLDLEEWAEHLEQLIVENPQQALYKYDNQSDILTFEPEYGASEILVPMFARQPNAYLMHYTKSAHVDHLLDLDHRGHTLMCWSLSTHTQSREVEVDSATCEERIEAASKCQEAGYPVRFRFSPIVPLKGWEDEVRAMIELLLATVAPEVISLQTLSRFPEYDIVERLMVTEALDERFLTAMRERPPEVQGKLYGPIPHDLRKEVYELCIREIRRHNADVPISICLESVEMWDDLEDTLGVDREKYPCCCGPVCVPGNPVMAGKES